MRPGVVERAYGIGQIKIVVDEGPTQFRIPKTDGVANLMGEQTPENIQGVHGLTVVVDVDVHRLNRDRIGVV